MAIQSKSAASSLGCKEVVNRTRHARSGMRRSDSEKSAHTFVVGTISQAPRPF
jgi:hypothetical protein